MTQIIRAEDTYKIVNSFGIADLCFNSITKHHSLHAAIPFSEGDTVIKFYAGSIQDYPTYLTVQTGPDQHITLEPVFLQYINHSCDPNVFFDTTAMQLVCVRSIEAGEEFRFFYPSTEWIMAQPFNCNCGSNNCLQFIKGAAYVSSETLDRYLLTDFILQKAIQKI